jgi:4-azaleucine resistance transporter AzlC
MPPAQATTAPATFQDGVRAGVPFAIAGGMLAISFGVVAQQAGFSAIEAILMSLVVYAGSAQLTAVAILAAGGGAGAAISAATLMNSRFLAMGAALGPSLPGGALKRAAQGQTVVDASWALASRGDGTFDRWMLFGSSAMQFVTWQTGTVIGAIGADLIGDPDRLGLDALFPAFFLALLMAEARSGRARGVAALGGLIALSLVPVTPAGVPVLVAGIAALVGLTPSARADVARAAE